MHLGPSWSRPDRAGLSLRPCNFFWCPRNLLNLDPSPCVEPAHAHIQTRPFEPGHTPIRTHPRTSMGERTRMLVGWICTYDMRIRHARMQSLPPEWISAEPAQYI